MLEQDYSLGDFENFLSFYFKLYSETDRANTAFVNVVNNALCLKKDLNILLKSKFCQLFIDQIDPKTSEEEKNIFEKCFEYLPEYKIKFFYDDNSSMYYEFEGEEIEKDTVYINKYYLTLTKETQL